MKKKSKSLKFKAILASTLSVFMLNSGLVVSAANNMDMYSNQQVVEEQAAQTRAVSTGPVTHFYISTASSLTSALYRSEVDCGGEVVLLFWNDVTLTKSDLNRLKNVSPIRSTKITFRPVDLNSKITITVPEDMQLSSSNKVEFEFNNVKVKSASNNKTLTLSNNTTGIETVNMSIKYNITDANSLSKALDEFSKGLLTTNLDYILSFNGNFSLNSDHLTKIYGLSSRNARVIFESSNPSRTVRLTSPGIIQLPKNSTTRFLLRNIMIRFSNAEHCLVKNGSTLNYDNGGVENGRIIDTLPTYVESVERLITTADSLNQALKLASTIREGGELKLLFKSGGTNNFTFTPSNLEAIKNLSTRNKITITFRPTNANQPMNLSFNDNLYLPKNSNITFKFQYIRFKFNLKNYPNVYLYKNGSNLIFENAGLITGQVKW